MGSACCREDERQMNTYSKKLMQGVQFKLTEKSQETKMIYIYDIESETSLKTQPFILLNSFEGLGQLNFNNCLYFCGGSERKGGTYFLLYDPVKVMNSLTMMINCLFDHKFPSMIGYKNEFIIVVGGMEGNVKCEIYGINKKKWKALPELPEPRQGCSLVNEEKLEYIYLFGGVTNDNVFCSSVLRLNMKSLIVWESVVVKENSQLLQKSNMAILKYDRNLILLLGGSKKGEDVTDSIVEFDLISKSAKESNLKLTKPARFMMSNSVDLNCQNFFFFDTQSYVHSFNKIDLKFKANHYVDSIQDDDTNTYEN